MEKKARCYETDKIITSADFLTFCKTQECRLSRKEEHLYLELLEQVRDKDICKYNEIKQILISDGLGFIVSTAKQYKYDHIEINDAI